MSLATYAAPFHEDNNKKIMPTTKIHSKKVSNLLNKIHETFDTSDNLADFVPPPMPQSSGVQKTKERHQMPAPSHEYTEQLHNEDSKRGPPEYAKFYSNKVESFRPFFAQDQYKEENGNDINAKLNDILNLLQKQQEQRTENVTEEIILYSFFGIFIIYLVDSFKRVGKYTR